MAHEKVYAVCENKCFVEVDTKENTDAVKARVTAVESGKAPNNHATTATTYGKATGSNYGHVKLSDAVDSASSGDGIAASPKAVKSVADRVTSLEDISIPVGMITAYGGATAPNANWLICNGQGVSAASYPALYSAIGTKYGGNSTTFNIPNLQGRVIIGVSSGHALASTGGEETHTLTINEIPSHNHSITLKSASSGSSHITYNSTTNGGASQTTSNTGGGAAHNNMQPYITLNYIIRAK